MASTLHIEPSREEDIQRLMNIVLPAFQGIRFNQLVSETAQSPENVEAAARRHLRAWQEHAKDYKLPFAIKCVHVDPVTSRETIVASAYWIIYDRPRIEKEYLEPHYLLNADWVEDAAVREEARQWIAPAVKARVKWLAGKPYGLLMYMATDERFRRRGAATLCVQWGIDRCTELGIPAYLEATDDGAPVYRKLGFEEVDRVECGEDEGDGIPTFPLMIYWPPGTAEEDKKPALPDYV